MLTWDQIAQLAAAGGMTSVAWVLLWSRLRDGVDITKALKAVSITTVTQQQIEIVRAFTMAALPPDADVAEKCRRCEQGLESVKHLLEQQLSELNRIYGESK